MIGILKITGLELKPNWINAVDAEQLVGFVDNQIWNTTLKRRVQQYGYRYDYGKRSIGGALLNSMPSEFSALCVRLGQELGESRKFDQIIVNEYLPGQGISAHVDSVVDLGPTIVSLSLLSAVCMKFQGVETKQVEELYLEPLSLLVLRQEARYRWTHAIPSRKSDKIGDQRVWLQRRISLTFRTLS